MNKRRCMDGMRFGESGNEFSLMGKDKGSAFRERSGQVAILLLLPIVWLLLSLAGAHVAGAAEVKLTPQITVGGSYDDNILLSENDKVSSSILTVAPSVALNYQGLLSNLRLKADWEILSYFDESDLNRTNQYYDLAGSRRLTERWTASADAKFFKDTTLNTYLQETGRVIGRVERDYWDTGAAVAYNLTLVSTITAGYKFQTASYDSDVYSDYDNHNARLNYAHRLKNQRDTLSLGPAYYYRSNDKNEVGSYSLDLGWARNWTSTTQSVASIGVRHTTVKFKQDDTEDDSVGAKASLTVTSRGLASTTMIRYFHDLRTTIDGDDVNVDNFLLNYRRSLTERFGIGLNARLVFSYKLSGSQSNLNDARYYWVEPSLFYRLSRNLDMSLRYRYQNHVEDRPEGNRTRERNIVWLEFSYAYPMTL